MKKIAIFGYNTLSFDAISRLDQQLNDILVVEKGFKRSSIDFRNDDGRTSIGMGGQETDVIFCFLPNNAENVFLTISARAIDKNLNTIAIVESPPQSAEINSSRGITSLTPDRISGQKTYELVKKPDITNAIDHTVCRK